MSKKIKLLFLSMSLSGILIVTLIPISVAADPPAAAEQNDGLGLQLVNADCANASPGDVTSKCGLNAMLETIINVSKIILAVSGSGALLMFMYGGVLWVIAAGNTERIQQGKQAMAAAAIGLAIILGSWVIINTTICALSSGQVACGDLINNLPWGRSQSSNPVDQLQEVLERLQQQ